MNTVDMTKGSPIKLLLQFSIPILIGNLFQQAYTLADRIIVGRFVGDTAFSAIGATNALSMTFMSMCMGAAIGTGVVVSQYFGAKDEKGTAASIANGGYTCILIALVMTIIALVTTKPVLLLLNTPKSLMPDALTYMYIFMGGLIAVAAYFTPFSILRALGDSKTPLIFLVFCSLLNIVLDLLFVVVLKTGVAGAAWATVLSEAIAAILCIIYAFIKVPQFRQAFHYRKIDKNLIIKTFQVVSGDMFSRIHEPVVRIGLHQISFNQNCVSKMVTEYAEILFNPVERMIVVRPCSKKNPNAIKWGGKSKGASYLCKIIYDSMGWDTEYAYRIPCQTIVIEKPDGDYQPILIFDLDNYIGRAVNKKEEIVQARQVQEQAEKMEEEAKSYFFPPEEDEEPEELAEIAEQVQKALELSKKIFGTPAFRHTSTFRSIDGEGSWEEWLAPARPLDTNHRYDADEVDDMLRNIQEDPPELPREAPPEHKDVIEVPPDGTGEEVH